MSKGSRFGMAFHQGLGFSNALMKIPQAEAVFWPGCALLNLDGAILEQTLAVLRRAEPEIALACGCCGQPTVYLFPEKAERIKKPEIIQEGRRSHSNPLLWITANRRSTTRWVIL